MSGHDSFSFRISSEAGFDTLDEARRALLIQRPSAPKFFRRITITVRDERPFFLSVYGPSFGVLALFNMI